MSAPPYMKLWVADYLADTTHLTRDEHGAYLLLLMAMWRAGGRLPADDGRLAKIALASPKEWAAMRETLLGFFQRRGGILSHKRVALEMAKYETTSERRKEAGKAGGTKTASKNKEKSAPNAAANGQQLPTKPEPEPESKKEPPKTPEGAERELELVGEEAAQPDPVRQAYDAWNELARQLDLPVAKVLDDARRRSIGKRLAEGGIIAWTAALEAVARSGHCRGANDRKWKADLDFVCQPKSWRRLQEGFYGKDAVWPLPQSASTSAAAAALAWTGPAEVWSAVVAEKDAAWAGGYLGRCRWSAESRVIVSQSGTVADMLRREVGHVLAGLGVKIMFENAA